MTKNLLTISNDVAVSLFTGMLVLGLLFGFILYFLFSYRRKQKDYRLLQTQKAEIDNQKLVVEQTLAELRATQSQLIHRERMASLGELITGIAHEIQNPLNFVNNFSEVNRDMLTELEEELKAGNTTEALEIAADIKANEHKITHHGKRADFIVKSMLEHSRATSGEWQPTNINVLASEFLELAYHGMEAKDPLFKAELVTNFAKDLSKIRLAQQDIGRVLVNLFNNAFYTVNQKLKAEGAGYIPVVTITTALQPAKGDAKAAIIISVTDNGQGIPGHIRDKIMQPFFSTKPSGEGTGLGLSLSYDIVVKGHGGAIYVDSVEGEFATFTVHLPYA